MQGSPSEDASPGADEKISWEGKKGRIPSWEVDYELEDRSYPVWCHIRVRVYFIILAFLCFILRVVVTLSLNQLPLYKQWMTLIYIYGVCIVGQ